MAKSEAALAKGLVFEKARLEGVELAVQELVAAAHWAAKVLQDRECSVEHEHDRACRQIELAKERAAAEVLELCDRTLAHYRELRDDANAVWVIVGSELP